MKRSTLPSMAAAVLTQFELGPKAPAARTVQIKVPVPGLRSSQNGKEFPMKQSFDVSPATGRDKNGLFMNDHPFSDGAVWLFFALLVLVVAAAGFVFWAKLTSAWPFNF